MDVLNSLFTKAGDFGLLQPPCRGNLGQRISLYADGVVLFIRPQEVEMNLTMSMLDRFGEASGLQTNLQKNCVVPSGEATFTQRGRPTPTTLRSSVYPAIFCRLRPR